MQRIEEPYLSVCNSEKSCIENKERLSKNNDKDHIIKIASSNGKKKKKFSFACYSFPAINRYVILVLYSIYCLISGPAYFNWNPLRDILFWNDAYFWLCDKNVTDKASQAYIDPDTNQCNLQKISINRLYTICVSTNFAFSMLGGILLDIFGPKVASIVGLTLQVIGWTLLGSSYEGFKGYIAAMIFIGLGVDCSFFPLLSVVNLFPKLKSTVIAVLGTCRSLSFAIPFLFKEITRASNLKISFSVLCYGHVGIAFGFCYLISLFCVPCRPVADEAEKHGRSAEAAAAKAGDAHAAADAIPDDLVVLKQASIKNDCATANTNVTDNYQLCTHNLNNQNQNSDAATHSHSSENFAAPPTTYNSSLLKNCLRSLEGFSPCFFSFSYLPLIPFIVFSLIRCVFFQSASHDLLKDCLSAFEIVTILSFIPCPVLGWLSDKIGILFVMHLCNFLATFMLICLIIPNSVIFQYISIFLFAIIVSFLMSQFYCYIASVFPKEHLGKLVGILTTVGGLFSLLADPMYQYSLQNSFFLMLGLLISFSVINILLLEIIRKKKKSLNKVKSDVSLKISNL